MFIDRLVGTTSHVVTSLKIKQRLALLLTGVTVICLLSAAIFVAVIGSQYTSVQGRLYINGQPAQAGINVTLLFNESTIADTDGTNSTGYYFIDVTGHEGGKALFSITLGEKKYIPTDQQGNRAIITFTQGIHEFAMDLFLTLQTESSNLDNDTDSKNSDAQQDPDTHEDPSQLDDSSGDSSSGGSGGSQDSDESGGSGGTDDSGTTGGTGGSGGSGGSDDSGNQGETDDSDQDDFDGENDSENQTEPDDNESLCELTIDKTVWSSLENCWNENVTAYVGETIRFRIILHSVGNGTAHNLTIEDLLPAGLCYAGSATVNETIHEPQIIEENGFTKVHWDNITLRSNESIVLHYNADLSSFGCFVSNATVLFDETEVSMDMSQAGVTIICVDSKYVFVNKTVRNCDGTFEKHVDACVGEIVEFCITIKNMAEEESLYGLTVIDNLPDGLVYVCDKETFLYYKDKTAIIDPLTNASNERIWMDVNAIFGSYLYPQEEISLRFFARVTMPWKIINLVNVTATIGSYGRQISCSDRAVVNASLLYQNLSVDVGDNYEGYRNESILLNATVFGGIPPYKYLWDLNNDGVYDDANGSVVSWTWTSLGNHHIHVKVIDATEANATDTACINISYRSLAIALQTLFNGYMDEPVHLTALAYGGNPPYSYFWDLDNDTAYDDGNGSSIIYVWHTTGSFSGLIKVIDNASNVAIEKTTVEISLNNSAPSVPKIIDGVKEGKPETIYEYTMVSTDPNGDKLYALWDWGDNSTSGWIGPYESGAHVTVGHYWMEKGFYEVRVKCRDEHGCESGWSKSLRVNLNPQLLPLLLRNLVKHFIERFPLLQQLLARFQYKFPRLGFTDLLEGKRSFSETL
jgi:uncharacterized repeat protein (TIGR01451 family)